MGSRYEKELAILKLQNALLRLPREDLAKVLKNTYQAMRIKHGIPYETKLVPKECLANKKSRPSKKKSTSKGKRATPHESCVYNTLENDPLRAAEAALKEYTGTSACSNDPTVDKHTATTALSQTTPNSESQSHSSYEEIEYPTFRQVNVPEAHPTSVHATPEFSPMSHFDFNKASLHARGYSSPQGGYSISRPLQPHFYGAPGPSRFRAVVPPGVVTPNTLYPRVPMR